MPSGDKKPIDLWLALLGLALGIALFLLPKTPTVIIICLVIIFLLLIHPLWNFWWIDKKGTRQFSASILFIFALFLFGYFVWPLQQGKYASSFLQVAPPHIVKGKDRIDVGDVIRLNVRWDNKSPERVFDIITLSKLFMVSNATDSSDSEITKKFNEWMQPFKESYLSGKINSRRQVGRGDYVFQTVASDPLTEKQYNGLFDGTTRIYIVSWCGWKDIEGTRDSVFDCVWLQQLSKRKDDAIHTADFVWHSCANQ